MAARARKVCFGSDSVEEQIKRKKVNLVWIAVDASERTKNKFIQLCEQFQVPFLVEGEMEVLSKAIGKNNKAVLGIEEANIAKQIQRIYDGGDSIG